MNFNDYQEKTRDTWESNKKDLERILFGIAGETGEVLEIFKKFYRGDYNQKFLDYDKIRKEIGDVLYYLAMLCNNLGMKLDDVAEVNLFKLKSRKKRNKIKGDGDER